MLSATYSPEDNKLRLSSLTRLDAETYAKVKAEGFRWAPKQEIFVAPAWSPSREDLLLELCGEIGDEDTSLVERAEQRAERFEDYSDNRAQDAERAHAAVSSITDNIPLGQPILVGHHSEKHARRDAAKIENGMRRAVKMWETSKYWKSRAAGAIASANYKELPAVRARRIKGLEADKRRVEKTKASTEKFLSLFEKCAAIDDSVRQTEIAKQISNHYECDLSRCYPLTDFPRELPASQYEGPMGMWSALDGGVISGSQAASIAIPSLRRRIPRADRWLSHYSNRLDYERAMMSESGGIATDKKGPEKGGACKCWASHHGGWSFIQKVNKVSVSVLDNWGNGGANFNRTIPFDKLSAVMSKAEVEAAREAGTLRDCDDKTGFFLLDAPIPEAKLKSQEEPTAFDAMRETLKAGVQVVSAPQLFPTPAELADRMVDVADIQPGDKILEPSAGTGRIIYAMARAAQLSEHAVTAVELNYDLADKLRNTFRSVSTECSDFLECNGNLGTFDRVLMNPPFAGGADIKHIKHAMHFLKPGGRLVAICANGPRQNETLKPIVEAHGGDWEELPPDTFKESGTGVTTVLLSFTL